MVLAIVGAAGLCCVLSVAFLGLFGLGGVAAMAVEPPVVAAPSASASSWKPATAVGRGATLTQALPGSRWLAQYGANLDQVVARTGSTEWVRTDSSGTLYEFVFSTDGTYVFTWLHSTTLNGRHSTSQVREQGDWALAGTALTLTPSGQQAHYTNGDQEQDKTDLDLAARTYQVSDVSLEAMTTAGAAYERFTGLSLRGPHASWDFAREQYELELQRVQ
ncbi:MAG: hypothetical protein U0228_08740 [Myxococcaceae bacterium]